MTKEQNGLGRTAGLPSPDYSSMDISELENLLANEKNIDTICVLSERYFLLGEKYFFKEKNYSEAVLYYEKVIKVIKVIMVTPDYTNNYNYINALQTSNSRLGHCYALGKGVEQDFIKAIKYFESLNKIFEQYKYNYNFYRYHQYGELAICYFKLAVRRCEPSLSKTDECKHWFDKYAWAYSQLTINQPNSPISSLWQAYLNFNVTGFADFNLPYNLLTNNYYLYSFVREFPEKSLDISLDMLEICQEIIEFLQLRSNSASKIILALYYNQQNKKDEALELLRQAYCNDTCHTSTLNNTVDPLAAYLLGSWYCYKEDDYLKAKEYLECAHKTISSWPGNYMIDLIKAKLHEVEILMERERREQELEDIMAMFAHKFRGPLDTIIYNKNHQNEPKLYEQAAQTMRGLLDIFAIISTDKNILIDKLKQDVEGDSNLLKVLTKVLDMNILHLLSPHGSDKIQQHYFNFVRKHNQCDANIDFNTWSKKCYKLRNQLQAEWEESYTNLLDDSLFLDKRLNWIEKYFFKLDVHGFNNNEIKFKEYGVTDSFLTVLLSEVLVNVFKYYSSLDNQAVILDWTEENSYQCLICSNPSTRSERFKQKGSGKGHVFLSALARKTNSQFNKPELKDNFVFKFSIPNELLKSK
jgi:TPR repeat protein